MNENRVAIHVTILICGLGSPADCTGGFLPHSRANCCISYIAAVFPVF